MSVVIVNDKAPLEASAGVAANTRISASARHNNRFFIYFSSFSFRQCSGVLLDAGLSFVFQPVGTGSFHPIYHRSPAPPTRYSCTIIDTASFYTEDFELPLHNPTYINTRTRKNLSENAKLIPLNFCEHRRFRRDKLSYRQRHTANYILGGDRMKKKLFCIALVLVLCLSAYSAAFAQPVRPAATAL